MPPDIDTPPPQIRLNSSDIFAIMDRITVRTITSPLDDCPYSTLIVKLLNPNLLRCTPNRFPGALFNHEVDITYSAFNRKHQTSMSMYTMFLREEEFNNKRGDLCTKHVPYVKQYCFTETLKQVDIYHGLIGKINNVSPEKLGLNTKKEKKLYSKLFCMSTQVGRRDDYLDDMIGPYNSVHRIYQTRQEFKENARNSIFRSSASLNAYESFTVMVQSPVDTGLPTDMALPFSDSVSASEFEERSSLYLTEHWCRGDRSVSQTTITFEKFLSRQPNISDSIKDHIRAYAQNLFKKYYKEPDRIKYLKGPAIMVAYSQNYGGSSCMSGGMYSLTEIYANNPAHVQMFTMFTHKSSSKQKAISKRTVRCMVWKDIYGKMWYDRIYPSGNQSIEPQIVRLLGQKYPDIKPCYEQNWTTRRDRPIIPVQLTENKQLPYTDGLSYFVSPGSGEPRSFAYGFLMSIEDRDTEKLASLLADYYQIDQEYDTVSYWRCKSTVGGPIGRVSVGNCSGCSSNIVLDRRDYLNGNFYCRKCYKKRRCNAPAIQQSYKPLTASDFDNLSNAFIQSIS